jgi:hypothetical protein
MNPMPRHDPAKAGALSRLSGEFLSLSRKRKASGWKRRRRPTLQPWLRGRIRPSSCRDRKVEA